MLINEPLLFKEESIRKCEELRNAVWVIDIEYKGNLCAVFYQPDPPEDYDNYFALYWHYEYLDPDTGPVNPRLMITDGSWIKDMKFTFIEADNGDQIMSHYRHHFHTSPDKSVSIDGGQDYIRVIGNNLNQRKQRQYKVKEYDLIEI